ncbi:MAG: IS1595 family transposase [Ruminococcaceae bacterium]|nr:IS1595 family transposase [Oscillospiraceae bacterium]
MKYQPNEINSSNLADVVTDIFKQLNYEDAKKCKENIVSYFDCLEIGAQSFDDLYNNTLSNESFQEVYCPNDDEHLIQKNGKSTDGKQRYRCKTCGKTFFAIQNSLVSNVNQDVSVWIKFIRGMITQNTMEELSDICGISKSTACNWRLRVFQALELLSNDVKLSGTIVADDTRLNYNFNGNHGDSFIYQRNPKKRGNSNTIHNFQKNQICVMCAIDEYGNSFSRTAGFGTPTSARVVNAFKDKIEINDNNILVTDGANYYKKTYETYNFAELKLKKTLIKGNKRVPDTSDKYHIQRINAYHSKLKRFMRKYNGVSSRYLPGYLLLFDYLQNTANMDNTRRCQNILSAMIIAPKKTNKELENLYVLPVSNIPELEPWEIKISMEEQKIYRDWQNHIPIKEITRKYKINRRKIYSIAEKVKKYNVHNKIISKTSEELNKKPLKPISERDWDVFLRCYRDGYKQADVAKELNLSPARIAVIIKEIKNRPEAIGIEKYKRPQKLRIERTDTKERNEKIYKDYLFLKTAYKTDKEVYILLSQKYNLSISRCNKAIFKLRKENNKLFNARCWKFEKLTLSEYEYYEFLQSRNIALVDEIIFYRTTYPKMRKQDIYKIVAPKYNVSVDHAAKIFTHQKKYLNIHDDFVKKKLRLQERVLV